MIRRTRTMLSGALVATAVVLAACGGGPSKADFVKKADTECQKVNAANPPQPAPRTAKEASAQQQKELGVRIALDKKLKSLDVPDSEKKNFDQYNGQTAQLLALIKKLKADADKNDEKTYIKDQAAFGTIAGARETVAKKIGFKVCGRKLVSANSKPKQ